jgi:hypothetical protein
MHGTAVPSISTSTSQTGSLPVGLVRTLDGANDDGHEMCPAARGSGFY